MRLPAIACACLLLLSSTLAAAQSGGVYKWKDARGVTHYSDKPPVNGRYGSVEANAAAKLAAPAKPDPRCTTARNNIQHLKTGGADIGLDANGDGKPDAPMTTEQRETQLRNAEAAELAYCTPASP